MNQPTTQSSSNRPSAINIAFVLFIVFGIVFAAWTNRMEAVSQASFSSAKAAVELSIGLIGIMAFWLGMMRVLEAGGCMYAIARALRPLLRRLFAEVPSDHPAMSAIILNISANMLGLGNAATPFGIRAMQELNRLNPVPGTATNAMCLFLAINTSSVALLPLGAIGVRAAANAAQPASIWAPSFLATLCSTLVGITIALFCARTRSGPTQATDAVVAPQSLDIPSTPDSTSADYSHLRGSSSMTTRILCWMIFLGVLVAAIYQCASAPQSMQFFQNTLLAHWLMPLLMLLIVLYGFGSGVQVYEAVTEGAKQGFEVAIRIIPFLVAILVAIGIFRASGALELCTQVLRPITTLLGMPAEVVPMAIIRPLSGSGAFAVMSDLTSANPNSYSAFLSAVIMGSTETTFYVLAVYFGAAGITRIRYALFAALAADCTGILAACFFSPFFFTAQ